MQQQNSASNKAMEVAKKLSRTLIGGGVIPLINMTEVLIPSDKVGTIIGKGGTTIREIEKTTNVKLQIESYGEPQRKMFITGSEECVTAARNKIKNLLESQTFKGRRSASNPTRTIQIPYDQVGLIIGVGGANIKKICQETACHLKIEREDEAKINGNLIPAKGFQNLHIMGSREAAEHAERVVMELLKKDNEEKLQRGLAGYGPHYTHFYPLSAQSFGTQAINSPEGYSSLLHPYTSGTPMNGYPAISLAYPQQQWVHPSQTYAVQESPGVQQDQNIPEQFAADVRATYTPIHPWVPDISQLINHQHMIGVLPGNSLSASGVKPTYDPKEGITGKISISDQGRCGEQNDLSQEKSCIEVGKQSKQLLRPFDDKTAAKQILYKPSAQVSIPEERKNIHCMTSSSRKFEFCKPFTVQFQNVSNGKIRDKNDSLSENKSVDVHSKTFGSGVDSQ